MLHMGRGRGPLQRKKYQQSPAEGKSKVLAGAAGHWGQGNPGMEPRTIQKTSRRASRGQITKSLERQAGRCGFPLRAMNSVHSWVLERGVVYADLK